MNTNQTNPLVVRHYDNTYQVCVDLGAYARANAPDQKSRNKVRKVVSSHSNMQCPCDLLYALRGAFDTLMWREHYKAATPKVLDSDKHFASSNFYRDIRDWSWACYSIKQEAPVIKDAEDDSGPYIKHFASLNFYRDIRDWAHARYDLVKEAPVITTNIDAHSSGPQFDVPEKDAEDDSDPYIKPSPKADPMEDALDTLQDRLRMADFGKRRIDLAAALFKSVVLERPSGATVLDVLERFGDEASELSWNGEYDAACFWDACVQISDDLRGDLAADQLKKAGTVTVPEPDAVLWEVTDDPNRALYRTEKDAMRATRELFPDEFVTLRYARLRRRNVKTFK